jgi:hypothetical protein
MVRNCSEAKRGKVHMVINYKKLNEQLKFIDNLAYALHP